MASYCRGLVRMDPSQGADPANRVSRISGRRSSPLPSLAQMGSTQSKGRSASSTTWPRSALLRNAMALGASRARSMASRSSSVRGWEPSQTNSTRSARWAVSLDRSTPRASTVSTVSRMPAVSMSRSRKDPTWTDSSTISRVVPGMSVTMARSKPASRFRRLDFPTLGLPTMAAAMPCRRICP